MSVIGTAERCDDTETVELPLDHQQSNALRALLDAAVAAEQAESDRALLRMVRNSVGATPSSTSVCSADFTQLVALLQRNIGNLVALSDQAIAHSFVDPWALEEKDKCREGSIKIIVTH